MPSPDRAPAELLTGTALTVFRLNGQFLSASEELAREAGLTAARWQVLGSVTTEPLSVSAIARGLGTSRQSVQRIADLLVGQGLAEYRPNPAHHRAKLLAPTEEGRTALRRITPSHRRLADALLAELGPEEAREALETLHRLSAAMDRIGGAGP
ncbi:DNA-binding MarR family transcriptional regulator [Nocardiopsis algeriensis]|uniref:DNA-binding MarR family transcriptional regulator n=1 Tax=Nocardiopsis algeriensis TaxID=1478215 RepID=A0A841IKJ8_9ACTN|nr:DNA-binding MarR family transcriptional regulator [Nocardiopsis algeriensis]